MLDKKASMTSIVVVSNVVSISGYLISSVGSILILKFVGIAQFGAIAFGTISGLLLHPIIDRGFLLTTSRVLGNLDEQQSYNYVFYTFRKRLTGLMFFLPILIILGLLLINSRHTDLIVLSFSSTALIALSNDIFLLSKKMIGLYLFLNAIPRFIFGTIGIISVIYLQKAEIYALSNLFFVLINTLGSLYVIRRKANQDNQFFNILGALQIKTSIQARLSNDLFMLFPSILVGLYSFEVQADFSSIERILNVVGNASIMILRGLIPWIFEMEESNEVRSSQGIRLSVVFATLMGVLTYSLIHICVGFVTSQQLYISNFQALLAGLFVASLILSRSITIYYLIPFGRTRALICINYSLLLLESIFLVLYLGEEDFEGTLSTFLIFQVVHCFLIIFTRYGSKIQSLIK